MKLLQMAKTTSKSFLVDLFVVLAFHLVKAQGISINYSIWLCVSWFSRWNLTVVAASFLFNAVKQFLVDLEPHYFLISSLTSIVHAIILKWNVQFNFSTGIV